MTVGELCNRQVVIAHEGDAITDAARRIRDFHVGALIVVSDQNVDRVPVGMLTDRDLVVRVLAVNGHDLDALVIGNVMSKDIVVAQEDDNVFDVVKKMRSFGIRRVPVVNERGGLEGILAFDDLVDLFAEQMMDLSHLLAREQKHERDVLS